METDEDKEMGIAGNSEGEKNIPVAPATSVHSDINAGEALLPTVAPALLDAPHIPPSVEEKTLPTPSPVVTPVATEKAKMGDALTKAASSLYLGNAVTEAQNAIASKTPATPASQDSEKHIEASKVPVGRGVREIGLEETPVREKPEAIPVESIKRGTESAGGTPRVRTYANDISTIIRQRNSTLTSIVGAEQQRSLSEGPREDEATLRGRAIRARMLLISAGVVVLIGLGALTTAFILHTPSTASSTHHSFIPVNRTTKVDYASGAVLPTELAKEKDSATLNLGEVEEVSITQNEIPISTPDILTLLGAPNELIRNTTDVMVGVHAFDHNQPFILMSVSAYDRAFAAMLSWETRMDEGLGDFFKPASLAPSSITSIPPALVFTDRAIQNIDVRESQPEWHILYAFIRPDLILITTNESTLREVVTRLSLQNTKN